MSKAAPLPEALLLDHAAGTTSPAVGLLLASHLALSPSSRKLYRFMETIGGALLDDLDHEPLERISATTALQALDDETQPLPQASRSSLAQGIASERLTPRAGGPRSFNEDDLPDPLRHAEAYDRGNRSWKKLGVGVAATQISTADTGERAHLLWARGGSGIAMHRHVGREVVLVLKGAFWDDGVCYGRGDVAINEDGSVHAPRIDDSEDCLCLAVTEAPVHFTGLPGILLNRFCRF
ncbi:MAG: ChrR family anti-sigma-E factor [Pseudomonadota bacterium]